MTQITTTARLAITHLAESDGAFILELLNTPGWLRHIGDRGVKSEADALQYLETGPVKSYRDHGFGLFRVALKTNDRPVGICGFLHRETLPVPDLGFALLPAFERKGYAFEASKALLEIAPATWGFQRAAAITSPDNIPSIRLLEKLGFQFQNMIRIPPQNESLRLFEIVLE